MASIKVTFSLDEETVAQLEKAAERLRRPKSQVVRDAVREYAACTDRLTHAERRRLLDALDDAIRRVPERPAGEVDAELAALRAARRGGGRGGGRRTEGSR
jgi:Arc/MetJ-type ribon-helix-helix transcriptional regulator